MKRTLHFPYILRKGLFLLRATGYTNDMKQHRILLVDDEISIQTMVRDYLTEKGFAVAAAGSCREALETSRSDPPDLVLLDVMLPDGDGFTLFEALRRRNKDLPILFLSARDEDAARLKGLGLGADDYITKPFLLEELLLRVKSVLRRVYGNNTEPPVFLLGETKVDFKSATVTRQEKSTTLTAKEYALLFKLYENQGNIVTLDALCAALWEGELIGYENTLMVHIRRLREKIESDPSAPQHLLTVRGLGYKLIGAKAL